MQNDVHFWTVSGDAGSIAPLFVLVAAVVAVVAAARLFVRAPAPLR